MFPIKKRLTCKETHENDPDEGDDASSDQSEANHPVGVFQVAAFHLIISEKEGTKTAPKHDHFQT